ncbi:hypothetical protein AB0F20_10375 [Streptomyces goshikiensis]|uniref:hypothetical protein n=1 Tax=Streptomyces goshikiensis TaxID=1942 RepID=UPI0033C493D6
MTATAPPQTLRAEQQIGIYGLLRMEITTNTSDAATTYHCRAPHVTGHLALTPGIALTDPTAPTRAWSPDLLILFGTEPVTPAHRRGNPLTINGVELSGVSRVIFQDIDDGATVPTARRNKNSNPVPLPPSTRRHAEAVLGAVLTHYRSRPDRPLLETAGRQLAAAHWHEQHAKDLHRLDQELHHAQTARDHTLRRVAILQNLISTTRAT